MSDMVGEHSLEGLLLRAADEFRVGGWIFTGFNLPVLAARLARRLDRADFIQVLEAGVALDKDTDRLLSSTTDYFEVAPASCYRGSTADVLFGIVPKCTRVMIDGANVDLAGRTNSTSIGAWARPKVRLPGGGGAADAAYRAQHLVLVHGGTQVDRLVADVRTITTAPSSGATVRLLTRWGTLSLGAEPSLVEIVEGPERETFTSHLTRLGLDVTSWTAAHARTPEEIEHAVRVLDEARSTGYAVDQRGKAHADGRQKGV